MSVIVLGIVSADIVLSLNAYSPIPVTVYPLIEDGITIEDALPV
jgi:hypothetical protein